jgi:DNA repair exonuclease SbcCD ATPase subunit
MTNTNYPSAGNSGTPAQPAKKDNRGLIYGVLIAALLGTWGYVIWDKNKTKEVTSQLQSQVISGDSAKMAIQMEYDAAIVRLDSISGAYNQLSGKMSERESEITKLKGEIRGILSNRNATRAELNRAKSLIEELNGKIMGMEEEIARLTQENQALTSANTQLSTEKAQLQQEYTTVSSAKTELESKVDVGSTLNAYNFNLTAINEKSGGKEVNTTKAKRADKFRISFDVDNRLANSGTKELFVIVTSPDGKVITESGLGSGTFTTREEGEKTYTNKVTIEYEQGVRKNVSFDLKQTDKYQPGDYKVEIYQNGFKIGNGKVSLKKGGIFG